MKQDTDIQNPDKIGEKTLDIISNADKFNKWIYTTIAPYCKGEVMEIGSGLGNISSYFLSDNISIILTDLRQEYCEKLHARFVSYPNLSGIINIDLIDPDFDQKFQPYIGSLDSVFAINVIEHINDDDLAIRNCSKLLKNGGNLVVMVPSYQSFFNAFDKSLGHYRRYNLKSLSSLFVNNNFLIVHRQYFNLFGLLGWFVSGSLQKNSSIPENQMKIYNTLVPVFKLADVLIFRSLGLSTIVVGEKMY